MIKNGKSMKMSKKSNKKKTKYFNRDLFKKIVS